MMDTLILVVAILTIYIVIPVGICKLKDWIVIRRHGHLAPEGTPSDRVTEIESRLHIRHTTIRGVFWIVLAIGLGVWLLYKNLIWMPDKRELHDLLGMLFIVIMIQHGAALLRFRRGANGQDTEMPNQEIHGTQ